MSEKVTSGLLSFLDFSVKPMGFRGYDKHQFHCHVSPGKQVVVFRFLGQLQTYKNMGHMYRTAMHLPYKNVQTYLGVLLLASFETYDVSGNPCLLAADVEPDPLGLLDQQKKLNVVSFQIVGELHLVHWILSLLLLLLLEVLGCSF